jgi:hypothetical protein
LELPFGHYDSLRARDKRVSDGADLAEVAWNEGEGNVLEICDWLLAEGWFSGNSLQA